MVSERSIPPTNFSIYFLNFLSAMEDGDWRSRSAMAESVVAGSSSLDSWRIQWQETNRRFYGALNKTRIQQGLTPINHPSLQIENQENSDRTSEIEVTPIEDDGGCQGKSSFEAPVADVNQEIDSPPKIKSRESENSKADSIEGGDGSLSGREAIEMEIPNSTSIAIGVLGVESKERDIGSNTSLIRLQASDQQSSSWSADIKGDIEFLKASPIEDSKIPNWTELLIQFQPSKVISYMPRTLVIEEELKEMGGLNGIAEIEVLNESNLMSQNVKIRSADYVIVEMPRKVVGFMTSLGIESLCTTTWPYDRGKASFSTFPSLVLVESGIEVDVINGFVLELGGISSSCIVVFDPGGVDIQEFRVVEGIVQAVYFEGDKLLLSPACDEIHGSIIDLFISWNALPFHRGRASIGVIQVQLVPTMNFVFSLGRVCVVQAVKQRLTMSGKLCLESLCTDMVEVPTTKDFVFDPGGLDPLLVSRKDDSHDRKCAVNRSKSKSLEGTKISCVWKASAAFTLELG